MKALKLKILAILFLAAVTSHATSRKVTGTVTDAATGSVLPGTLVMLKGSRSSVYTDSLGKYLISATESSTLIFRSIGYIDQEIVVGNKKVIDISLKSMQHALKEVLIIGYGAQKKVSESSTPLSGKLAGQAVPGSISILIRGINGNRSTIDAYEHNTEDYNTINENRFVAVKQNPLSTFGIDVDAASYSNVRRFINNGTLPPVDAVRIEELINYFDYNYPQPTGEHPISINTEISTAPWNSEHKLVRIGLQGKTIPTDNLPASNLVFLIDVSGSMSSPNKLPLVQASMRLLADQVREKDKVSIVVYAGAAGLVLKPTSGRFNREIKDAINNLRAGGSTAGGEGIKLAYKTAFENFIPGGNNRVILATDGDFNVGASSDAEMQRLIEVEREKGVFLTVLGFGMGNYKDNKMETLADKGNGNYAYIDEIAEAKKVLINEFGGTLFTIAKDVKLQVEFNPAKVQAYRLIGYENRMLAKEDFNNDKKDAGDLGSGHRVTALYEIIPIGIKSKFIDSVNALKYQRAETTLSSKNRDELLTINLRYKDPAGQKSKLLSKAVRDDITSWDKASDNFRFAAAVAGYGMLLRKSEFKQRTNFQEVISWAEGAKGNDKEGYRAELIKMMRSADLLEKSLQVPTDKKTGE